YAECVSKERNVAGTVTLKVNTDHVKAKFGRFPPRQGHRTQIFLRHSRHCGPFFRVHSRLSRFESPPRTRLYLDKTKRFALPGNQIHVTTPPRRAKIPRHNRESQLAQ